MGSSTHCDGKGEGRAARTQEQQRVRLGKGRVVLTQKPGGRAGGREKASSEHASAGLAGYEGCDKRRGGTERGERKQSTVLNQWQTAKKS